jgi:hypothetical protein
MSNILRIFAAVVASVILGGFSIWGVGLLYESVRGYTWPHVNGTIISSVARSELMTGNGRRYMSYWPEVRYEYIVGNRHVTADRIRFIVRGMNEKETQRVVSFYPVGKAVTVYFDPRDVTAAVLEPGIWWPMIPILALSITLTLLMPTTIYSDFRERK